MNDCLQDRHYQKLSQLMEQHTGIQLPASKRTMLEGRLRKRVRDLRLSGLDAYGANLFEKGRLAEEFPFIVDCVTTNTTDFFREPDHFDFLRDHAIPTLLRAPDRAGADVKLWSAASSIGVEAYTIAIVLAMMQDSKTRFRYSILGTDICSTVLEQARRAVYPAAMLSAVPEKIMKRYVMRAAKADREDVRIVPELRRLVRFEHLNLMDESYPFDRDVDVIFCRNVLIYFARSVQQKVLERLISHLRPNGYLILGHSESFALDDKTSMRQVLPTVFQRISGERLAGRAA
ncbi:MAG: CheR family methyltransferase [Beijerinckiaceae bacterium]|nr:CheR family methyltransferase [Beijerinckiaceae bacterium]